MKIKGTKEKTLEKEWIVCGMIIYTESRKHTSCQNLEIKTDNNKKKKGRNVLESNIMKKAKKRSYKDFGNKRKVRARKQQAAIFKKIEKMKNYK